ncbi:MAG TPA: hypothetical protein VGO92_05875 [Acidimicrobiales bacterium]|nr:hypothetical protein [Acidimicrobiales bacterium]
MSAVAVVTVVPSQFTMVAFSASEIAALSGSVADRVGLPADLPIAVEVDETTPLGRTKLSSVSPAVVNVQSGAFENPKQLRSLSPRNVEDVLGRIFHRLLDRLSPAFADAPADDALTLAQATAWDTYAVGRCAQLGYEPQKQRRLYHFRNRHGFNDVADRVFERLWSAPAGSLTWADILAACEETAAGRGESPAA